MLSFLGASENVAFVSAILLMLLIGVVQLIGLGGDVHADFHADVHADVHVDTDAHLDLLGWLGVGRLPLLMLLVTYLAIFGIGGLVLQQIIDDLTGAPLSPWIAIPAVAVASLPLTGLMARGLARILPRDHTTAVPLEALLGRSAQIVTGRASAGSPARARAEDLYGQQHYVMVEPDLADQSFEEGETVLLVRREGECFRAVARGDYHLPRLDA